VAGDVVLVNGTGGSDDDEVEKCLVCNTGSVSSANPLILCDGEKGTCDKCVHLRCSGLKKVPTGEWFCLSCAPANNKGKKEGGNRKQVPGGKPSPSPAGPPRNSRGKGDKDKRVGKSVGGSGPPAKLPVTLPSTHPKGTNISDSGKGESTDLNATIQAAVADGLKALCAKVSNLESQVISFRSTVTPPQAPLPTPTPGGDRKGERKQESKSKKKKVTQKSHSSGSGSGPEGLLCRYAHAIIK
jgi:hypothetical protein